MNNTSVTVSGKVVKKVIAAIISLAILGGLGYGIYRFVQRSSTEAEAQPAYREYSVTKGNITVGTSESGTVSIDRAYQTLPVRAEVEEVYVKVGTVVKKGDKLAKLNVDDVATLKTQYENKIADAKLTLESAQTEAKTKITEAAQIRDSSYSASSSAEDSYKLSVTKINTDITSAEKNLTEQKKQLEETLALKETYPSDYAKLTSYETVLDEYNSVYDGYSDTYKGYESVLKGYQRELTSIQNSYNTYVEEIDDTYTDIKAAKEAYEKAETELEKALETLDDAKKSYQDSINSGTSSTTDNSNSNNTSNNTSNNAQKTLTSASEAYEKAYKAYETAEDAYSDAYRNLETNYVNNIEFYEDKIKTMNSKISDYKEMMEDYSDEMSAYSDKVNKYKSEYEDFKTDFNDTYDNLDADGIEDKINSLKTEISNSEYDITKLSASKDGDILTAEQKLEAARINGSTADEIYTQTVEQINNGLNSKQNDYDALVSEYDELLENLGDGVYIRADCDGAVAEVNVAAGDTLNANQTAVSLLDSSALYISVSVSEDDISALSVGQACSVALSAYENLTLDGEIDTIAVEPSRSSGSVTYAVNVKFEVGETVTVYSGMTADVTFLQKQVSDVLYVSVNAVTYKSGGISTVLVYDANGSIAEKEVKTGFSDGRYVEITEGLSAGDRVLAESAVNLK